MSGLLSIQNMTIRVDAPSFFRLNTRKHIRDEMGYNERAITLSGMFGNRDGWANPKPIVDTTAGEITTHTSGPNRESFAASDTVVRVERHIDTKGSLGEVIYA